MIVIQILSKIINKKAQMFMKIIKREEDNCNHDIKILIIDLFYFDISLKILI